MTAKIHVAGPMVDLVQKCARCEFVLTDYRGAMCLSSDTRALSGWAEGSFVTVWPGNPQASATGRSDEAIDCDARVM